MRVLSSLAKKASMLFCMCLCVACVCMVTYQDGFASPTAPVAPAALTAPDAKTTTTSRLQLQASASDGIAQTKTESSAKIPDKKGIVSEGLYTIICKSSGKALSVASGSVSHNANVQQAKPRKTVSQYFWLSFNPKTGTYRLRSAASGLALDAAGKGKKSNANVRVSNNRSALNQEWSIEKSGKAYVLATASGEQALTVKGGSKSAGANVIVAKYAKKNNQKWMLKLVKGSVPNGTYNLSPALNLKTSVSVKSSSINVGAKLQTAKKVVYNSAEKWVVKRNGKTGYYTIKNKNSKLLLEPVSLKAGAKLQQSEATGSSKQQWKIDVVAGGLRFTNAADQTLAIALAGSKKAGTSLVLAPVKAQMNQKFRLTDVAGRTFKIYLNPGHGWNSNGNGVYDPGASGNGYREADFAHDLARRVISYCKGYDIKIINGEKYKLAYWKRLPKAVALKCDVIVSIHFDWSGAGTSGTHTMVGVQGKAKGSDLLNRIIHKHLVKSLGLRDLGTFHRSDITCVNGRIPSMLMEVCFMDNAHDVHTFLAKRDSVARGLANALLECSRQPSLYRK